jgi:diguanylate cyclase (GGDEF)-like protein
MKLNGTNDLDRLEIDELFSSGLNFVHFSKNLERVYRNQYQKAAAYEFRYRGPMILILYGFLTYGVYQNIANVEHANEWLNLYKWVGIIILCAWLLSFSKRLSKFFDIYTCLGSIGAVSITFLLINSLTHINETALLHAAMMYAVVIIYSFIGMRFYTALIAGWGGGILGIFLSTHYEYQIDWNYLNHTYVFSSFLGMSLAYAIDRQHRENYLRNCIIEIKQDEITKQSLQLEQLSLQDPLTGLANRRYLTRILESEWDWALQHNEPISLVMLDIDYFKNYNDALGHIAGDICLQSIASVLKVITTNHAEIAARYGGEEFLLVYPQTDLDRAEEIANLIINNVRQLQIAHPDSPISPFVTVSLGVISIVPTPSDELSVFIDKADKTLYQAKKLGRNRYIIVEEAQQRAI